MPTQLVRPDVADMVLRTYERPLHPELFDSMQSCTISVAGHEAIVRLGTSGHVLVFRTGDQTVTEVATTKHDELPLDGHGLTNAL